ncbi:MAG: zinc-ribbon domain-containing protein [Eggerthellaceae bacterium]
MSPRQRGPEGWAARTARAIACSPASTTSRASTRLLAEWDWGLNGDLRPDGIVSGSARRVWWRCGHGHAWQISAYNRTGGPTEVAPTAATARC